VPSHVTGPYGLAISRRNFVFFPRRIRTPNNLFGGIRLPRITARNVIWTFAQSSQSLHVVVVLIVQQSLVYTLLCFALLSFPFALFSFLHSDLRLNLHHDATLDATGFSDGPPPCPPAAGFLRRCEQQHHHQLWRKSTPARGPQQLYRQHLHQDRTFQSPLQHLVEHHLVASNEQMELHPRPLRARCLDEPERVDH